MTVTEKTHCLNCNFPFEEDHFFCAHCGQRRNLPRLTFKDIIQDFLSSVFNLDAPFPKTVLQLFKRPGKVVREVIDGRRKSYYAAIKYTVLCVFINIVFTHMIDFDPVGNQMKISNQEVEQFTAQQEKVNNYSTQGGRFISKYLNYFIFLFPFSIALFSKIFFHKSPFNFAERVVLGFYLAGQYVLIGLIPIGLTLVDPKFIYLFYFSSFIYLVFAFYQFHKERYHNVIFVGFKSIIAVMFSTVTYFGMAGFLAFLIIKFFNLT